MDTYDTLMKALALMTALKEHSDPADKSPLREPLNKAWDLARKDAAAAAEKWTKSRGA